MENLSVNKDFKVLFKSGKLSCTGSITNYMNKNTFFYKEVCNSLIKYFTGDWGNLDDGDKRLNNEALELNEDIIGRYCTSCGDLIVTTDGYRTGTELLLLE